MIINAKLAAIPAAMVAVLAGATAALRDLHYTCNAVVQQHWSQADLEQAARDRQELDRGQAERLSAIHGAGQAVRGFNWRSALENEPSK